MSLSKEKYEQVESSVKQYIEQKRPPENIRDKVDIGFRIEDQSVIIFEIRPSMRDKSKKNERRIAKATYVKSKDIWKVYWQRQDLKWHEYKPKSSVTSIDRFLEILEEDRHHCFWG